MQAFKYEINSKEESEESYIEQKRGFGCGKLRLGSIFTLNDGIYSVLYVANLNREYFKLSLFNQKVKLKIILEEKFNARGDMILERKLMGHKKAFKGITQSIKIDEAAMQKQFVYLDQIIDSKEFIYVEKPEDAITKKRVPNKLNR